MNRSRTTIWSSFVILTVAGVLSAGCQSGGSTGAPPHADSGAIAQGMKQGVTPAASGKQLDSEQQKFLDREQQSAGK
jgi:hypothetical protein